MRTNESTITMRVKQVISRMIDGASVSSVMAKRIRMPVSTSCGWWLPPRVIWNGTNPLAALVCAEALNAPNIKPASNSRRRLSAAGCAGGVHFRLSTCCRHCAKEAGSAGVEGSRLASAAAAGSWLSKLSPAGELPINRRCCS